MDRRWWWKDEDEEEEGDEDKDKDEEGEEEEGEGDERLLVPKYRAFEKITKGQVEASELTLKMTDKEIAGLPDKQRSMITTFRDVWKQNPDAFQKRPRSLKKYR